MDEPYVRKWLEKREMKRRIENEDRNIIIWTTTWESELPNDMKDDNKTKLIERLFQDMNYIESNEVPM